MSDIMANNIERMKAILEKGPKKLSQEEIDFLWIKFGYLNDEELTAFLPVLPNLSDSAIVDKCKEIMKRIAPKMLTRDPGFCERWKKELELRMHFLVR